ncbi:MAG: GNAT family N-acetyltransferase [Rhodospirillaceae bacterium]|nr:GNAT family N-acetyltransferase [Rhodospirillaceae bacterium]
MSGTDLPIAIIPAATEEDFAAASRLFREYQISLGVDLAFQGFEEELAGLPGKYAAPRGAILLARAGRANAGVVALRPLADDATSCEMKRLYVRPLFRAAKLGRRLAEAVIAEARRLGYRRIVLDTLAEMNAAQALYRALGFIEIDAYYSNPLPGTRYFARAL